MLGSERSTFERRAAAEPIDDGAGKIRRVVAPDIEHDTAVSTTEMVPIGGIAAQAEGKLPRMNADTISVGAWLASNNAGTSPDITSWKCRRLRGGDDVAEPLYVQSRPRMTMKACASSGCSALAR